jgi:16S rRNA (guanine527-N7)-methyltransferase
VVSSDAVSSDDVDALGVLGAVSRETAPEPPMAATLAFGSRLAVAVAYADRLAVDAVDRGLLGPREVPRLWDRHLLNCAAVAPLLAPSSTVADVGSGAGLPGLVIAIQRPDVYVTLVEPLLRRVTFLAETVAALGLDNVTVERARAEAVAGHRVFDVVTARAVAPIARLATWCLPLVQPGGRLIALKGRTAAEELTGAEAELRRAGADSWDIAVVGDELGSPTTLVTLVRGKAPLERHVVARGHAASRLDGPRTKAPRKGRRR